MNAQNDPGAGVPSRAALWRRIEQFRDADLSSSGEMALRYTIIIVGMISATHATGNLWISVWLSGYVLLDTLYRTLLRRAEPGIGLTRFRFIVASNMLSTGLYSSCAAFLFTYGTAAMMTIGVAAASAQGLFNLMRHRQASLVVHWDSFQVVAVALFMGLSVYFGQQDWPDRAVVLLAALGVSAYYLMAQYRTIIVQRRLDTARAEAIQAQKMQAVGQLTAGVAHDFNNLLTVIRGNIELAELAEDPVTRRINLGDAKTSATRAASLTRKLLSYSRKSKLSSELIALPALVAELGGALLRLLPATVPLDMKLHPGTQTLYCDRNLLETALINLVINARDAMEGRGTVRVAIMRASPQRLSLLGLRDLPARDYAIIEVQDTGAGIPPEILAQVTEPFFTTKEAGKGSGLGLSMVKGFSEQSGGGLRIDSGAQGTRVSLVLPMTAQ